MTVSFIGVLISAMSISCLMISIQSIEKSYRNAGKHSLTQQEYEIINSAGLNTTTNINLLKGDVENLPQSYQSN